MGLLLRRGCKRNQQHDAGNYYAENAIGDVQGSLCTETIDEPTRHCANPKKLSLSIKSKSEMNFIMNLQNLSAIGPTSIQFIPQKSSFQLTPSE